jgi:3'(2'), 5'-bisphosphate nucleotidase
MLEQVLRLVERASVIVQTAYDRGDARVDYKAPGDPVTDADRAANALLCDALADLYPEAALVGEESTASARGDRASAPLSIFVDPLDGTRDFVDRTGQFAVMVGVAWEGRAVLGVLKEPVSGRTFATAPGTPAFELDARGQRRPIRVSDVASPRGARLVVSRTRPSPRRDAIAASLGFASEPMGSAGVKGARVAAGEVEAFLHLGMAGYLWDAAAIDALVHGAGGRFTDETGARLEYRQPAYENLRGVVAANAALHDVLLEAIARTP